MILADTNVVSEMAQVRPNPVAMAWLAANEPLLCLPSVVIAEVSFGIEKIRPDERAKRLDGFLDNLLKRFRGRIYGFDEAAALAYGKLLGSARRRGVVISVQDGMIAAIAARHDAALATRNGGHFQGLNLRLINPWEP